MRECLRLINLPGREREAARGLQLWHGIMVVLKYGIPRGCKKSPSTGCWLSVMSEDYVSTIASKPSGEEHCQPGHSFFSKYLWQYAIIPYVCVMLYGVQNASRAPPHLIFTTVLCDKGLELRSTFQIFFKKILLISCQCTISCPGLFFNNFFRYSEEGKNIIGWVKGLLGG